MFMILGWPRWREHSVHEGSGKGGSMGKEPDTGGESLRGGIQRRLRVKKVGREEKDDGRFARKATREGGKSIQGGKESSKKKREGCGKDSTNK